MREEDNPVIADEVVKVDGPGRGVGLEVWGDGAKSETAAVDVSKVTRWLAGKAGSDAGSRKLCHLRFGSLL